MSPISFEIANSDFPIQSGPLIDRRDTWHRTSGFRGSAIGNSRCKGLTTKELAIPRIDQSRRSTEGHVASDPAYRSSAFRGFRHQNTLHFGFAIGEIPMATWQLEPRAIMGYTWRHSVRSGFRRSGVCGRSEPRHLNRRFSDRGNSRQRWSVDP
jgi:hypothetical protein